MLTKKYVNEQLDQSEQLMKSEEESTIEVESESASIQLTVNASNELQFHENDQLTSEKLEETLIEENMQSADDFEITEQLVVMEPIEEEPVAFTIAVPEKISRILETEQLDQQILQSAVAVGTLEPEVESGERILCRENTTSSSR